MKTVRLPEDSYDLDGNTLLTLHENPAFRAAYCAAVEKNKRETPDQDPYPDEWKFEIDCGLNRYIWGPSQFQLGTVVVLGSKTHVSPDDVRAGRDEPEFFITRDEGGIQGNSNSDIRRYHGWRGTTNDCEIYAHGQRRIVGFKQLRNGTVSVRLSNDITPLEP